MNRVLQRLKSVAEGECPMDEISDWTMETDDVDKFLYHTEEGYSKKELKKWDGVKKAYSIDGDISKKLEKFLDIEDDQIDSRVVKKPKEKKKPKALKIKERAKRRKQEAKEAAEQQWSEVEIASGEEDEGFGTDELEQPSAEVERVIRKLKRKRKVAKNLAILEADESAPIPAPATTERTAVKETKTQKKRKTDKNEKMGVFEDVARMSPPWYEGTTDAQPRPWDSPERPNYPIDDTILGDENLFDDEKEDEDIVLEIKKRDEPAKSSLAELAEQIRRNIDKIPSEDPRVNACKEPRKKFGKKLKGEDLKFVKVTDEPSEPSGTAFVTAAQRKLMKKQKKQSKVNKEAVKQNYSKEFKLKFREQIAEFKPFKKLDKPEVVGKHQGDSSVPNAHVTPTKSCLRVKTPPRKIVGNKGKLKWQG